MYELSKKQKLDFILEKITELEISAYEIGKKTGLNTSGIERILNKTVKNPQENTLNKILEFLENKVLGSEIGKLKEPNETYKKEENDLRALSECHTKLNQLTIEIVKLQNLLRKNNIEFKNIFEEE